MLSGRRAEEPRSRGHTKSSEDDRRSVNLRYSRLVQVFGLFKSVCACCVVNNGRDRKVAKDVVNG